MKGRQIAFKSLIPASDRGREQIGRASSGWVRVVRGAADSGMWTAGVLEYTNRGVTQAMAARRKKATRKKATRKKATRKKGRRKKKATAKKATRKKARRRRRKKAS